MPCVGSPWLPCPHRVTLDPTFDPGVALAARHVRRLGCCLLGRRTHRPFTIKIISGLNVLAAALPAPLGPRVLSCLRIKRVVTDRPPRLDIRPVASGYLRRSCTFLVDMALPGRNRRRILRSGLSCRAWKSRAKERRWVSAHYGCIILTSYSAAAI